MRYDLDKYHKYCVNMIVIMKMLIVLVIMTVM